MDTFISVGIRGCFPVRTSCTLDRLHYVNGNSLYGLVFSIYRNCKGKCSFVYRYSSDEPNFTRSFTTNLFIAYYGCYENGGNVCLIKKYCIGIIIAIFPCYSDNFTLYL